MTNPPVPSSTAWVANADPRAIAAVLRGKRIAVVTHAKPDGDAAGSVLALVRSLNLTGGKAHAWFVAPNPRWLADIAGQTKYADLPSGKHVTAPPSGFADPEAVAIVDTGSWSQLAELKDFLRPRRASSVLVDHHLHGDADVADTRLIRTSAAATTQILADVCCELLGVASPSRLPKEIAEPLYLGLATDTGWFKHQNVTPAVMRLAADLLEAGTSHTWLYTTIEQREQPARLRLQARALASLQLHDNGRLATMLLRSADFDQSGASRNDSTGFVEIPLTLDGVMVSALITEDSPSASKLSLRSKAGPGEIDVNQLAGRLGGGGHARAAGAKTTMSGDQALAALLAAFRK